MFLNKVSLRYQFHQNQIDMFSELNLAFAFSILVQIILRSKDVFRFSKWNMKIHNS